MPDPQTPTTWLALIGEWDLSNAAEIRFDGKPFEEPDPDGGEKNSAGLPRRAPAENPTHGIALSNLSLAGGTVEAEFTFNESDKAVGELIWVRLFFVEGFFAYS